MSQSASPQWDTSSAFFDWDSSAYSPFSRSNTPSARNYTNGEVARILGERKSLAAIYLTCRALTVVLKSIHKNALDETMGGLLEETIFEQFRHPDV